MAEVKEYREKLIADTGSCMLCGTSPGRPRWPVWAQNQLCCHEVLNGGFRDKVLDEPSCLIVACWECNGTSLNEKGEWPLERQLAVIKVRAQDRYDLKRVMELRNPNAPNFVTEDEVDAWVAQDWENPEEYPI